MGRKIHAIYDTILKIIVLVYLIEFLKYIGEERDIDEVLRSEVQTIGGETKYLDFLCKLNDGTLCHIEFEFPVAYSDDLRRYYRYNIIAEVNHSELTETIVFNFSTGSKGDKKINVGYTKDFHPKTFYLGDIDFVKKLNKINLKLNLVNLEKIINPNKHNIKLTYEEELHLMLMSLAEKYTDKKPLLKSAVNLLKNEELFHKEKIGIIKRVIEMEIEAFIPDDEDIKIEGDEKMSDDINDLFNRVVNEVNIKKEQEAMEKGIEKGMKKGREKEKEDIARKMKKHFSPEVISKLTGLSVNAILLL